MLLHETEDELITDPVVSLKLEYHALMTDYIKERIERPYDEDRSTTTYVHKAVAILEKTAHSLSEINSDHAALLEDALMLAKCFSATVLAPVDNNQRMASFLAFINALQPDMSKYQPEVVTDVASGTLRSPDFWGLLQHYLMVGQFSDAYQLLLSRSNSETDKSPTEFENIYTDLTQLVLDYPLGNLKQSLFMRWRQQALNFAEIVKMVSADAPTQSSDYLYYQNMALLLTGDTDVLLKCADNWPEALSGLTLYLDPTFASISSNFEEAYTILGLSTVPTWEEGCRALFENRIVAALGSLRLLDVGTAVVFSEFCQEKTLLRDYNQLKPSETGIREDLGLEYVQELLKKPPTINIGLEILSNINSDAARDTAKDLLPILVRESPDSIEPAIETATQLGLYDLEVLLCTKAASTYWENQSYIPALQAFYRGGDLVSLNECSWDLFQQILITQAVPQGDVVLIDRSENEYVVQAVDVLRDFALVEEAKLDQVIRDSMAPSAVLVQLLDAMEAEDVPTVIDAVRGLLALPDNRTEYFPLIVALLSNTAPGTLPSSFTAMLMDSLDAWDRSPPKDIQRGQEIVKEALKSPSWQAVLGEYLVSDQYEMIGCLRRQLARTIAL